MSALDNKYNLSFFWEAVLATTRHVCAPAMLYVCTRARAHGFVSNDSCHPSPCCSLFEFLSDAEQNPRRLGHDQPQVNKASQEPRHEFLDALLRSNWLDFGMYSSCQMYSSPVILNMWS
jgi:hypothetical protein